MGRYRVLHALPQWAVEGYTVQIACFITGCNSQTDFASDLAHVAQVWWCGKRVV